MSLIPLRHELKLNVRCFKKYNIPHKLTRIVPTVTTSRVYLPKFIFCGYVPGSWKGLEKSKCPAVKKFCRISAKSLFLIV